MQNTNIEYLLSAREFHHRQLSNADGSPQRWRRNGQLKTWKTRPGQFRLPIKRGLWQFDYITHLNVKSFVPVE